MSFFILLLSVFCKLYTHASISRKICTSVSFEPGMPNHFAARSAAHRALQQCDRQLTGHEARRGATLTLLLVVLIDYLFCYRVVTSSFKACLVSCVQACLLVRPRKVLESGQNFEFLFTVGSVEQVLHRSEGSQVVSDGILLHQLEL